MSEDDVVRNAKRECPLELNPSFRSPRTASDRTATGLFAASSASNMFRYSQFASHWAVLPFPIPILQESDWAFSNPASGVIDSWRRPGLSGSRYRLGRHGLAHGLRPTLRP